VWCGVCVCSCACVRVRVFVYASLCLSNGASLGPCLYPTPPPPSTTRTWLLELLRELDGVEVQRFLVFVTGALPALLPERDITVQLQTGPSGNLPAAHTWYCL
jgi:hypothetical protein